MKYTEETLGICESVITIDKEVDEDGSKLAPGGLVYINWLYVEPVHRGKKLAYYLLYSVLLYAKSVGCDRIELVDATGQSNASYDDNIYSKICLHHLSAIEAASDRAMYASIHTPNRNKKLMVGNLDEVILRLEGDPKACGMRESVRGLTPENITSNLGKRTRWQSGGYRHSKRSSKRRSKSRSKRRYKRKSKKRSKRRSKKRSKRRSKRRSSK